LPYRSTISLMTSASLFAMLVASNALSIPLQLMPGAQNPI